MQKFVVFHADHPNFGVGTKPKFPDEYSKVAAVRACNLEEIFRLTNHIEQDWTENDEIEWSRDSDCRSTSVGDIVIDPNGDIYYCKNFGWEKINH